MFKYLFDKRTVYFILLFCFLLRLVLVLGVDPLGSDTVDGFDYHHHALSLLSGDGYPLRGSLPFMRAPLYPFWLAFTYLFFDHQTYLTARIGNAVLDTAACFVFYKLIMLIWENKRTAVLATIVYAVNPLILFFSIRVRVEALFGLLLVTFFYLLIKNYKNSFPAYWSLILIGVVAGLACLTRPNVLPFVVLLPFWLIYVTWNNWGKGIKLGLCLAIGCSIIILPWTIRNYRQTGELILITDGFGFNFWISNSEIKQADLKAGNYEEYLAADKKLWDETTQVEAELQGKSIKERENHYTQLGMQYVKNNFADWLRLNVLKFAEFWSPMARLDMQGWKALVTLPFGLLTLSGFIFFLRSFSSPAFDRPVWYLFALLFLIATATGVLTWSSVRYRVPMVDAYLIPFSLYWVQSKFFSPKN